MQARQSSLQTHDDRIMVAARPWFLMAGLYNLVWGILVIVLPRQTMRWLGLPATTPVPLWQVVGMLVMVYAPAYWWAARRPDRFAHYILIGFIGKVLGPLGFAWGVTHGTLPWTFGLTIITNDLIWWPIFWRYLRAAARRAGGWLALLTGD